MEWVARGQDTVTIFLGIMIEATPFLVLGVLVSQALALVVREGEMVSWVPRGRLASLSALAGLGALFPVCECGNVPVALSRSRLCSGAAGEIRLPRVSCGRIARKPCRDDELGA